MTTVGSSPFEVECIRCKKKSVTVGKDDVCADCCIRALRPTRRWKLAWLDYGPFYAEGPGMTEEEARPLLRGQWQTLADELRSRGQETHPGPYEENEHVLEVGLEELKFAPRPSCCEHSDEQDLFRRGPFVRLQALRYDSESSKSRPDPHWVVCAGNGSVEASFCPFCGTKLPKVELGDPTPPAWTNDDDYCGTCGERNMCCECNPPASAYSTIPKPEKAQLEPTGIQIVFGPGVSPEQQRIFLDYVAAHYEKVGGEGPLRIAE